MDSSAHSRRRWWTLYGAVILVLVNVVWARAAGAAEWTDSAIFGSPVAALLRAVLGYVAAVLRDRRDR